MFKKQELRIAVFASGGGTDLQSLLDQAKSGDLRGQVALVISNNSSAFALQRARNENIPAFHISGKIYPEPGQLAARFLDVLKIHDINLIVLAGYMKMLPPEVLRKFRSRVINIHPALLPRYGGQGMYGLNVHRAVLESGDKVSGATVHFVDEIYDHGAIIIQRTVPVMRSDTPETLAHRVLEVEHRILPQAAGMFL